MKIIFITTGILMYIILVRIYFQKALLFEKIIKLIEENTLKASLSVSYYFILHQYFVTKIGRFNGFLKKKIGLDHQK